MSFERQPIPAVPGLVTEIPPADDGLYRVLFGNAAVALARIGSDGRIVEANAWAAELLGGSHPVLAGQWVGDFLQGADQLAFVAGMADLLAGASPLLTQEVLWRAAVSPPRRIRLRLTLARQEDAGPICVVGCFEDLNQHGQFKDWGYGGASGDRPLAEGLNASPLRAGLADRALPRRLAAAERGESGPAEEDPNAALLRLAVESARLQTLLETARDGIHILDGEGRLVQFSQSFCRMLGYTPEQAVGLHVSDWDATIDPAHLPHLLLEIPWVPRLFETRHRRQDGSVFDVEINAKGIVLDGRRYLYASSRDITERKRTEEALRRARDEAERVARANSRFLAAMSHEIRTPMNAIIELAERVLDTRLDARQQGYLGEILESSRQLLGILSDIPEFSEMELGRVEPERREFRPAALLREASDLFAASAGNKGLRFLFEVADEVPEIVVGDPLRIRQILANLASNAVKFTARGEIRVVLDVATEGGGGLDLRFAVRDTGIGLSAEAAARLFQPFTPADCSTTPKFGGSGPGLAISRQLAELMGGSLEVQSLPGSGSTFVFTVRVERPAGPRLDLEPEGLRRPFRVLLVEDNPLNELVTAEFLKKAGLRVTVAHHGSEAIEALRREVFDIVLMDVQVPVMDGCEAVRQIRDLPNGRSVPIVAMTAAVLQQHREASRETDMDDHLDKPGAYAELIVTPACWVVREAPAEWLPASPAKPAVEAGGATLRGFEIEPLLAVLDGDMGQLVEILVVFLLEFADLESQLDACLAAGDSVAAERLLHKLSGAAGNVGAVELHRRSRALDLALKAGACNAAHLAPWRECFRHALMDIRALVDRHQEP